MDKKKAIWMTRKLVERFSDKDMADALWWCGKDVDWGVAKDERESFQEHVVPLLKELEAETDGTG